MTSVAHDGSLPPLTVGILCVLGAIFVVVSILDFRHRALNARREAPQEPAIAASEARHRTWATWLLVLVLLATATALLWTSAP